MVNIQKLREKAKVLDLSYGYGTGKFVESVSTEMQDNELNSRCELSASSVICIYAGSGLGASNCMPLCLLHISLVKIWLNDSKISILFPQTIT